MITAKGHWSLRLAVQHARALGSLVGEKFLVGVKVGVCVWVNGGAWTLEAAMSAGSVTGDIALSE
eukprot:481870-Prymnesium_polylepis.1